MKQSSMRTGWVAFVFLCISLCTLAAPQLWSQQPCPPYGGIYSVITAVKNDPDASAKFIGLPLQTMVGVYVYPNNTAWFLSSSPQMNNLLGTSNPATGAVTFSGHNTVAGFPNVLVGVTGTFNVPPGGPASGDFVINFGPDGLDGDTQPTVYTASGTMVSSLVNNACTNGGNNQSEPVSTATGELYNSLPPDLALGGPLALVFRRYYGSFLKFNGITGSLGNNWMHNFDLRLYVSGTNATVLLFGGRPVRFVQVGSTWQLLVSDQRGFQLAASGANYQFLDPAENLIYTFSASGVLIKIEDRNGNALTVTPGSSGPATVSDGLGRTLSFTYSSGGKLTSVQDPAGRSVSFSYTGDDLTGVTDANGKTTAYAVTTAGPLTGLMTSATLPAGNAPFTQGFDSSGRVVTQKDSLGNTQSISYNTPAGGSTTVTDALSNSFQHTQKNLTDLTGFTDAAGQSGSITYDGNDRRNSLTDRLGDTTSVTYHNPSGYLASVKDALGNTTTYTYAAQPQGLFSFYVLTKVTYPDGASSSLTYDALGNVLSSVDRAGKITTYTYNTRGQTLTRTNPAAGVTTYTYNTDGTVASVQSPAKDTSKLAYDDKKRPSQITYPDNSTKSSSYDNRDNLLNITDERGKVWAFSYNDNNNLKATTDPTTKPDGYAYNTDERLASFTDRLGKASQYAYNQIGKLKTATNAAGESYTYAYDALGRLISLVDSTGKGDLFAYDKEGVPVSRRDALSRTWSFTSDKLGRLVATTTPLAENFSFVYDSMGRLTSSTNPLSKTRNYAYDARGLLSGITLPAGVAASFTRNDLGLITGITDPNGGVWIQAFDSMGRLTSQTDPLSRATSYTYDFRNRVSRVTTPEGAATLTYDAAGNVTQKQYSDSTTLTYSYDDNGRVVSGNGLALVYDANGRIVSSNGQAVTRDSAGRVSGITYAAGKNVQYSYNTRGLLAQVTDWAGGVTTLTYDDARQLVSLARPNGATTQYTYDKDGRLSSITETEGSTLSSITLIRDAAGQITSADRSVPQSPVLPGGALPLAYNAAHQVTGFTYDGNGRLTHDGIRSYTWDLANRLASYTGSDGSASFTYDAFGLRISKTTPAGTQNYVVNYALGLPSITTVQDSSGDHRYYVYLPNGVLLYAVDAANNKRHFYHFDEIGSTVFLTDDTGAVTDAYGITPYGETVSGTGTTENPFTFGGAQGVMQETGLGLFYMRARFYDSVTARFLSRDPIPSMNPKAINPYPYAAANPLLYSDPSGMSGLGDVAEGVVETLWYLPEGIVETVADWFRPTPPKGPSTNWHGPSAQPWHEVQPSTQSYGTGVTPALAWDANGHPLVSQTVPSMGARESNRKFLPIGGPPPAVESSKSDGTGISYEAPAGSPAAEFMRKVREQNAAIEKDWRKQEARKAREAAGEPEPTEPLTPQEGQPLKGDDVDAGSSIRG